MPVVDTWHKTVKQPDGSTRKVRSAAYGRGKRWAARYRDDQGQQRSPKFATRAEAERHLKRIEGDLSRGQYIDPKNGNVTVRAYAEDWRKTALHRPATARKLEGALNNHIYPAFGDRKLSAVRPSHVQSWVTGLGATHAPSTVGVTYGLLAQLFKAAVRDELIAKSPCRDIQLPEVMKKAKPVMSGDQVRTVADQVPQRYRAVVMLAAGSGLRQGEMFGLEVRHVDFLRRTLTVEQQLVSSPTYLGELKTPASYRTIPLTTDTVDMLAEHLAQYPPAVVELEDRTNPRKVVTRKASLMFSTPNGAPVRRSLWSKILAPAIRAADLPERSGLHALRRFYASLLIRYGEGVKVVQERLGHASAAVTLDTYAGLWPDNEDRTREAVEVGLAGVFDVRPMCAEKEG